MAAAEFTLESQAPPHGGVALSGARPGCARQLALGLTGSAQPLPSWREAGRQGRDGVVLARASSILGRSGVPGMSWALNPYTGCSFGCAYCYATFMGRPFCRPAADWGRWVVAKANLGAVLKRQLRRLPRDAGAVAIGSVTDPYQPAERSLGLTRAALQLLVQHRFASQVLLMTKSPLVLRDVALLARLDHDVGISLGAPDDAISRACEPQAPSVARRLDTLARLNQAGLRTFVFVGPIFPHAAEDPEALRRVLAAIRAAGTVEVYLSYLSLPPQVRGRLLPAVARVDVALAERLRRSGRVAGPRRLGALATQIAAEVGLRLKTPEVIDH